jgi:hypothetical protein
MPFILLKKDFFSSNFTFYLCICAALRPAARWRWRAARYVLLCAHAQGRTQPALPCQGLGTGQHV